MPLFKGKGFKSTPSKAIDYIIDEKKAELVSSYALDDSRPYAEQFKETAELYGKGDKFDERKYYHFKQSFAPGEITPGEAHKLAEEMAQKAFPNYECVISTHTDKAHIHSHIIVNSVSFEDGKKLNLRNYEYGQLKDLSNTISQEHGYSVLDWRKPSQERTTPIEKNIMIKGGTSWKEELKEVIAESIKQSDSFIAFKNHLEKYDVTIERNTEKTISFKHPQKEKAIRGERLGTDFTKGAILNGISEQRNRRNSTEQKHTVETTNDSQKPVNGVEQTKQSGVREQPSQRELNGIYSTIRGLEEGAKQYSPTARAESRELEIKQRAETKQLEVEQRKETERIERERKQAEEHKRATQQQHKPVAAKQHSHSYEEPDR